MREPEKHLLQIDTQGLSVREKGRILAKLSKRISSGQVQFHSSMKENIIPELAEITVGTIDKAKVRPLCLAAIVDRMEFKPGETFYLTKVTENGVYGIYGKRKNGDI